MSCKRSTGVRQTLGGESDEQSGVWHSPGYDIGEEGGSDQEEEEKFMDVGHPILVVRTSPSQKDFSVTLMRYFGSNSKSGGGECEVTRVDGQTYCAVFQNQDDQRRVLGRGNHVIEVTVPVTVHDIGREDLARIRQVSGDEERMKMLQRLAVRIPRISRSAPSVEKMDTGRSSAMYNDRSSAMYNDRSSAMYNDGSSAMYNDRSSAMYTDRSSAMYTDRSFGMYTGRYLAAPQKAEEPDKCPICQCEIEDKVILEKCKHAYCKECLQRATAHKPVCAICGDTYGTVTGDQPDGTMSVHTSKYPSLPGYPGCGTIEITYDIPSGIQKENHPRPGKPFSGARRTAYLPDNKEGKEILSLLRKAFDQRLIFTVGDSRTTGATDTVTWNDVQHKTSTHGGPQSFGYPDPDYLSRVRDELRAKGIE